ncbi:unnamed protein product [Dibothriocephalus latus]|uniref:Uncharacterized protein n=1 Tax=Dibothriocephalus latus TaxID=60516 RepID=A0A3P6P3Q4_DIBLA|nr:unnamed protein product [Dibothriocephalus latus]
MISATLEYEQIVEACLRLIQNRLACRYTFYEFPKEKVDAGVFQSVFLCCQTSDDASGPKTPLRLDELASFSVHASTEKSPNWKVSAASLHCIPRAFPDAAGTALFGICIPIAGSPDASGFSIEVTAEPSLPASLWRSVVINLPRVDRLYLVAITSTNVLEMSTSQGGSDRLLLHLTVNCHRGGGAERVLLPCPLTLSLVRLLAGDYDPPVREADASSVLRWTAIAAAVNPCLLSLQPTSSTKQHLLSSSSSSLAPALEFLLRDHTTERLSSAQTWTWLPKGLLTGCCIRVHERDDHALLQLLAPPKLLPIVTKCLLSQRFSEQTGISLSRCESKIADQTKGMKPQLRCILLALLEEVRRTTELLKASIGEIMQERVPLMTDITPLANSLTAADTVSDWRSRATATELDWSLLKVILLKKSSLLVQLAHARLRSDELMQRFCLN